MPRLFVAIRPPAAIRSALLAGMGGVEGARWQDDDQLHLTLRFIGPVDRHQEQDILSALAAIRFTPFPLSIEGMGTFDRQGRIDTLWAGVQRSEPLERLQAKVERACQAAGLPPERRAFHPHITLARFPRSAGPPRDIATLGASLRLPSFPVDSFDLIESELGHSGAVYHLVERYLAA